MRFVLAFYGTRGDVEPGVAVGCELQRRGHQVQIAVPPDLLCVADAAGLAAVAFGLNVDQQLDGHRNLWTSFFRDFWRIRTLITLWRQAWEPIKESWARMNTTLVSLAEGADVLFTGLGYEQAAANVAEYYDIPLATLHWLPITRVNGQVLPALPSAVVRSAMIAIEWLNWWTSSRLENAQRRALGLPKATRPSQYRITARSSLEIQAYEDVCFPGLAAEWAKWGHLRPFVGALTTEHRCHDQDEVVAWIADGPPPIYFGFGSIPLGSPFDTVKMIAATCRQLGERALICANGSDFSAVSNYRHIKIVDEVNYTAVLPACRAVVHHGGAGTTAAGLRAGVPTVILWTGPEQMLMGEQIKHLKVGTARRLSATTCTLLAADLHRILTPQYLDRARQLSFRMTNPARAVADAADLLENFARARH